MRGIDVGNHNQMMSISSSVRQTRVTIGVSYVTYIGD